MNSRGRAYIIEDEFIISQNLKHKLIENEFEVVNVVSTGEKAIEEMSSLHDQVDFILMDIMLDGELDGIETAEQIKAKYDIPIIFLTAYSSDSYLERSKKVEPYSYILKPFSERELLINIEIALYKHDVEKKLKKTQKELKELNNTLEQKVSEQTEELINQNKELSKLSSIIEQSHESVFLTNTDGIIEYVNQSFIENHGYNRSELIGNHVGFLMPKEGSLEVFEEIGNTVKSGKVFNGEVKNYTKNGDVIYEEKTVFPLYDSEGEIIYYVSTAKNITERKYIQQQNIESQRILSSIFKAMPAVVFIYDESTNRLSFVNDYIEVLAGYTAEEMLSLDLSEISTLFGINSDYRKELALISEAIKNDEAYSNQQRIKTKEGKLAWINYSVINFQNDAKQGSQKLLGIATNITKQRNSERQLKAMMRLHEIMKKKEQKLKTLSLLQGQEKEKRRISVEIHDSIGQLLTATKLHLENIENHISDHYDCEHDDEYTTSMKKVKGLIKTTISEVRKISNEIVPSDLHDFGLYSPVKTMLENISGSGFELDFESNLMDKRFDPVLEQEVYRIIQEAINNSLKHANSNKIQVFLNFSQENLKMQVKDNGKGFVANEMIYGQRGAGIISMKERAKALGAKLTIQSEPNEGCLVDFEISTKQYN